jgi:hypothetical protein
MTARGDAPGVSAAPVDAALLLTASRRVLARFPRALVALVADLDPDQWRARPAPGRWAPLEVVCHLRDEEAEDFGARVRVAVAGSGRFAPIRPAEWVNERRYLDDDPERALAAFHDLRQGNLGFLAELEPTPEKLRSTGESPGGLVLSGLDLLAAWVAHDRLHLRQLAGTLARIWAANWDPLRSDYAGELPYPPPEE